VNDDVKMQWTIMSLSNIKPPSELSLHSSSIISFISSSSIVLKKKKS